MSAKSRLIVSSRGAITAALLCIVPIFAHANFPVKQTQHSFSDHEKEHKGHDGYAVIHERGILVEAETTPGASPKIKSVKDVATGDKWSACQGGTCGEGSVSLSKVEGKELPQGLTSTSN